MTKVLKRLKKKNTFFETKSKPEINNSLSKIPVCLWEYRHILSILGDADGVASREVRKNTPRPVTTSHSKRVRLISKVPWCDRIDGALELAHAQTYITKINDDKTVERESLLRDVLPEQCTTMMHPQISVRRKLILELIFRCLSHIRKRKRGRGRGGKEMSVLGHMR